MLYLSKHFPAFTTIMLASVLLIFNSCSKDNKDDVPQPEQEEVLVDNSYELVKQEIVELEDSQKIYTNTDGCSTIVLVNKEDYEQDMETSTVFKDVQYVSEFSSDDEGAFDWMDTAGSHLLAEPLIVGEGQYSTGWDSAIPYREGVTTKNYTDGFHSTVNMRPHSQLTVSGKITYLERSCQYTLTLRNKSTGELRQVSGIWKQKVPLRPSQTLSDYESGGVNARK